MPDLREQQSIMSRWVIISILCALPLGCAHHKPPRSDDSAISGFTALDDGTKQIEEGLGIVDKGPLSDAQRIGVQQARTGVANVRTGASVAHRAYDASAKMNEPGVQKERDRIFWCKILGGAAFALGIGLTFSGTTTLLKGAGAFLAITGLAFATWVMVFDAIDPAMKFVAMGIGAISVVTYGWFCFEKFREKRELKQERTVTKEVAPLLYPADMAKLSPTTQALVADAKQDLQPIKPAL